MAPDGSSPLSRRRLSYSSRWRFASLSLPRRRPVDVVHFVHAHLTRRDAQADDGVEEAALHRRVISDRLRLARLLELEIGLAVEGCSGGLRLRHPIVEPCGVRLRKPKFMREKPAPLYIPDKPVKSPSPFMTA